MLMGYYFATANWDARTFVGSCKVLREEQSSLWVLFEGFKLIVEQYLFEAIACISQNRDRSRTELSIEVLIPP
jgi:hypothetical protein